MIIRLASCTVQIEPHCITTTLPGGAQVLGMPHHDAPYRRTAREYGYGTDVARLNRTHEVGHSLLAHVLGLPCSPTFRRVAAGDLDATDLVRCEEAAVLALEAYANQLGLDLVEVAKRLSK